MSNAAVLYAVTTIRRARSVASALIGNLAASDLWHCAFCLPIQLHYQLTDRWVFGGLLCRTMFASFAVPLYSSSLSAVTPRLSTTTTTRNEILVQCTTTTDKIMT